MAPKASSEPSILVVMAVFFRSQKGSELLLDDFVNITYVSVNRDSQHSHCINAVQHQNEWVECMVSEDFESQDIETGGEFHSSPRSDQSDAIRATDCIVLEEEIHDDQKVVEEKNEHDEVVLDPPDAEKSMHCYFLASQWGPRVPCECVKRSRRT